MFLYCPHLPQLLGVAVQRGPWVAEASAAFVVEGCTTAEHLSLMLQKPLC